MLQLRQVNSEPTYIASIVAMSLRVLQALRKEVAERLELKMMRHKADVREIDGAQWFNKSCPSERFAAVLWDEAAKGGRRKQMYCYRGGGALDANQAEAVGGIVCLCKSWTIAASLLTALKLGMCCSPFGPPSNGEAELCGCSCEEDEDMLSEEDDHDNDAARQSKPQKTIMAFQAMCCAMFNAMAKKLSMQPWNGRCSQVSEDWVENTRANMAALLQWWEQ